MKWLKAIFTTLSIMFMGMFGGQKEKSVRRFGIPSLAFVMDLKRGWPFLLLIPVLIMGYGENSVLMKWIGIEFVVRIIYAVLLSVPFIFFGLLRFLIAVVLLSVTFLIHAGSIGYISWFGDILVEDIIRYGVLGSLISFNLSFSSK